MGANSGIEWTDHTFNPWIGCTKVSQGCKFCYAETLMDHRLKTVQWGPQGTRVKTSSEYWRKPVQWNAEAARLGTRPRVFCASLADVFEKREELEPWRLDLFELIHDTPHLDWLLLTKRPEEIISSLETALNVVGAHGCRDVAKLRQFADWLSEWLSDIPPANVWLGTSVEDQAAADLRVPALLNVSADKHFLSAEPLIGPVTFRDEWLHGCSDPYRCTGCDEPRVDWIIVGGESGPGARPMQAEWVRDIRDQCERTDVAFFFKQWGGVDKKKNGRILDGQTYSNYPAGVIA